MRIEVRLALFAIFLAFASAAILPPPAFADPTDACAVLTAAQVSSAIGIPVKEGTHPTPDFLRTCTWIPSNQTQIKAVTFYIQSANSYDAAKRLLQQSGMKDTSVGGVGDDAYFQTVGTNSSLVGKKGNTAFKVAIYTTLPVDKAQAMEKTLAVQALSKF